MANYQPLVSIVLPVYNGEQYVRESINSIVAQRLMEWELIVIDDCSTDNTKNIVLEYIKKDSRIRLYLNDKNIKLPASLNKGFSKAIGKYYTWTSHDNCYAPDALMEMVSYMEAHPKCGMVYADYYLINEANDNLGIQHLADATKLPVDNTIGACFLYKKEVADTIGNYDENLFLIEDYDYWLRIYQKFQIKHLDNVLYYYRTHKNSLSVQKHNQVLEKQLTLRLKYFDYIVSNISDSDVLFRFYDDTIKKSSYRKQLVIKIIKKSPAYMVHLLVRLGKKAKRKMINESSAP